MKTKLTSSQRKQYRFEGATLQFENVPNGRHNGAVYIQKSLHQLVGTKEKKRMLIHTVRSDNFETRLFLTSISVITQD